MFGDRAAAATIKDVAYIQWTDRMRFFFFCLISVFVFEYQKRKQILVRQPRLMFSFVFNFNKRKIHLCVRAYLDVEWSGPSVLELPIYV